MFNCGKLIVKPLNKDCDECEAMAKLFETTTALSNDCEEMAKLFETTTAPSNNCEEMAELFATTLEPTNNSDMLDQLCNTTSNPLSLTSIIESPAITTITSKVNKGEKMLAMESMVGFEIGDIIRIVDILNPNNYENTIISDIDSLIILIERPLQRCYNMNSIIINMTKLINIPELFTTIS